MVRFEQVREEQIARLLSAPSLDAALIAGAGFTEKALELDPAFVSALCTALRSLRPEETAVISLLESTPHVTRLISIRQA